MLSRLPFQLPSRHVIYESECSKSMLNSVLLHHQMLLLLNHHQLSLLLLLPRQVYSKDELSPLPFQPPVFFMYATTMLSGAFKVFQYVITIMVRRSQFVFLFMLCITEMLQSVP
jgi:hypothetical protein